MVDGEVECLVAGTALAVVRSVIVGTALGVCGSMPSVLVTSGNVFWS